MVVLLALGIGFSVALFAVIYSLVNMPTPGIERDETLVRIRGIERDIASSYVFVRIMNAVTEGAFQIQGRMRGCSGPSSRPSCSASHRSRPGFPRAAPPA